MTATIELNSVRRKLQSALGDHQVDYFTLMKSWFRKLISKEDFDFEARRLLSADQVHLHNEFLLAILNKCQTLANFTPVLSQTQSKGGGGGGAQENSTQELLSPSKYDPAANGRLGDNRLKKGKIKKSKSNRFDHRFQPVSITNVVPDADAYDIHEEEKTLRYCPREPPILPDVGLIHGRMLVTAWEEGLEGVEDAAVELAVAAVEQQLRVIINSLISLRNGYKLRDGMPYSMGAIVPDPWLLNSQRRLKMGAEVGDIIEPITEQRGVTSSSTNGMEDDCLVPVGRPLLSHSQQRAMLEVACGSSSRSTKKYLDRRPLSLFDLLETLQKSKSLIPSHTVHALNIERCITRLYHKGPHD